MRKYFTPTFIKASLLYFFGKLKKDPVFIIGTGRCGSSLLVEVLQSNDQIYTSQEEFYATFLESLEAGFTQSDFLTDIIDFQRLTKESLSKRSALKAFYIKVLFKYLVYREAKKGKRYLLKSPAVSLQLGQLNNYFPNAKYIHLYRNPYAVTLSLFKKEYFRVQRYRDHFTEEEFKTLAAQYWNVSMAAISKFLNVIKQDRYMEFSYESFTEAPEKHCEAIALFLSVDPNFQFDFAKVKSTNYKIAGLNESEIQPLNAIFSEMATVKGYDLLITNVS